MSVSPPIRRLSTSSSSREDLIYQYEAEEERIINILSRKLEQLREEKIELENVLEAESESHVNRLSRELSALRLAQQQQQQQQQQAGPSHVNGSGGSSPQDIRTVPQHTHLLSRSNGDPSQDTILDALRRENEALRSRLVETEQDFIRISRLNELYREELIQHRRRLGLPVDSLIGLPQPEPFSQPMHRRSSTGSSPSSSIHIPSNPSHPIRHAAAVPIPRPPSQIRRPTNIISSESTTPLSHSPSSTSTSPFPFSPLTTSPFPTSYTSAVTTLTTPPSIGSVAVSPPTFTAGGARMLSYPSVPPPSLSSSFGSPSTSLHHAGPVSFASRDHDGTPSPVESFHSRRNSFNRRGSFERRVAETGSLQRRGPSQSQSRRESVERGGRVAETGTLVPRHRADSFGLPVQEMVEDADPAPASDASPAPASPHASGDNGVDRRDGEGESTPARTPQPTS
ncbi:hypothetical protein LXA43DRAFT_978158 [Ganoderma leucocontextum]|nr:hypothetical protein LXA43DRAFT_978158 [Ganoderma leucocontextum]